MTLIKKKIGKGKVLYLCQTCIKAFNNGQYCYYCNTIYFNNANSCSDGKDWIQCDNCSLWVTILNL